MRLLCVANWSEGRNSDLLSQMRAALAEHIGEVHYDGSDEDHNRTVTAFSGDASEVERTVLALAELAFEGIDMRRHEGVHPRIGALDVCPFIVLDGEVEEAVDFTRSLAGAITRTYDLPIFLYEKSETGKHAADLPSLRKGQYEGLIGRELDPDFGPRRADSKLGATVMGVRDWLLAINVDLPHKELAVARQLARDIRVRRDGGDARFAGVRALGLELPRRHLAQVSMNLTMPDLTPPDPIVDWISEAVEVVQTELIGVIRERDLAGATRLPIVKSQVIAS